MSTKDINRIKNGVGNSSAVESSQPNTGTTETNFLISALEEQNPTLSVIMPTLNEEQGIAKCIRMIQNALTEMEISGEIIVSDSSTDRTPEIAESLGARVVVPDKSGYGYAYRYAFERARGDYIAIGDADCTYDFEELPKLLALVQDGDADMAMGSRLEGDILPGSMPPLHQHIGNPLLTTFLNMFYGVGVSDAHSGMRVISREALQSLKLKTRGMEFASEMIMEAGAKGLTIEELPITYHPREGEATLESFSDGWRHVKFMLQNAPGYLFSAPGITMGGIGGCVMALALTQTYLGPMRFGSHSLLAGTLLLVLGFHLTSLGVFASVASNPIRQPNDPITKFLSETLSLERGAFAGLFVFAIGGTYMFSQLVAWAAAGFNEFPLTPENVVAFALMVLGLQVVFALFLIDAVRMK